MNAVNTAPPCGEKEGQGAPNSSPLPKPASEALKNRIASMLNVNALPTNFQIGCTKIVVVNKPMDQEGRTTKPTHHSLSSAMIEPSVNEPTNDILTVSKSHFQQMQKSSLASGSFITETHGTNSSPSVQSPQVPINARAQLKQDSVSPLANQMATTGTTQQFSLVLEALARISQTVEQNTIKLQALSNEISQYANIQGQILQTLKELQKSSIAHRAEMDIRMDFVNSPNSTSIQTQVSKTLSAQQELTTTHGKSVQPVQLKPVDSLEDLERLEKLSKNKNFVESLARFIKSLFPADFDGTAGTYCHRIVDLFFTRQFLTKCSWTGSSINGIQKIGFRYFPYMVNLFISVVQHAYPEFTEKEGIKFLRMVIGHAKMRLRDIQRASTERKRRNKTNQAEAQPRRKKAFRPKIEVVENSTDCFEIDPLKIEADLDELDIPNGN
ncbi:uncharacterized protein LOC126570222 isoform X1 [Anopheles aquasalis]|uniref:uncharacterized protein LOC126570222 isoform X1 n=2 Tax=Anopheles aquasalis TaxID=42839 RepID=UPI00215A9ED8|nr:uncharacterized protein LOC126570222 isoform X1 [Anopheles aquasalis]